MALIMTTDKDFQFTINKSLVDNTNKETYYYTLMGDHDKLDEDELPISLNDSTKVLAKKTTINHSTKYFVKVGTHGKIYNPIGLFSEGNVNKFLSKIGKKAWEFKEVNMKVFNLYLSFLKTKNLAWLNNAEREMS